MKVWFWLWERGGSYHYNLIIEQVFHCLVLADIFCADLCQLLEPFEFQILFC